MIRIDEIYNNVFLPAARQKGNFAVHWFEPFGSTSFDNICSVPALSWADTRFVFYDQEPLHKNLLGKFIEDFRCTFNEPTVIITSEYNSDNVSWLCDTYDVTSQYYFFHGWASLDWYRGYNRTFLKQPKDIQHTYLFPNNIIGGERKHRLELFRELEQRKIIENNLVSFPEYCPFEKRSAQDLSAEYNLGIITSNLPLQIDSPDNFALNSHKIDMWTPASKTLVHVVGETVFYGNRIHLTEKTFKPIVLQQPFIIASCRGSLKYLQKYGFETFSSVWDESYDSADDNVRCSRIASLLEELEYADKEYLSEQCAPIVEHNHNWFYGGGFEKVLWNEIEEMMAQW